MQTLVLKKSLSSEHLNTPQDIKKIRAQLFALKSNVICEYQCGKCVQVWSFFWSVFSHIRTEYGEMRSPNARKYGPEKTPYLDTFHTVYTTFFHENN